MREIVRENFPKPRSTTIDIKKYLEQVDENYISDTYHSLSIEGYQVSSDLIEKVRSGEWNPDATEQDRNQSNALAARGDWYSELFQPSVAVSL